MRQSTQQRYQRVQHFYRRLSKAKLSHEFCLEVVGDFFNLEGKNHIGQIMAKDLGEIPAYEHQDLDDAWIDGRIRKHLEEIAPIKELEQNQEIIEE